MDPEYIAMLGEMQERAGHLACKLGWYRFMLLCWMFSELYGEMWYGAKVARMSR